MATKEEVLEATIDVFSEKGIKFTMDELAKRLSISKKTIYTFFPDKKTLFFEMTDYVFDRIKDSERQIYEDSTLSTLEKLEKILIVLPDRFVNLDFSKLTALRENYPEIYDEITIRLDSGWEMTTELYLQATKEGLVRDIDIGVLKLLLEGAITQLLLVNELSTEEYREKLQQTLDVLLHGLLV